MPKMPNLDNIKKIATKAGFPEVATMLDKVKDKVEEKTGAANPEGRVDAAESDDPTQQALANLENDFKQFKELYQTQGQLLAQIQKQITALAKLQQPAATSKPKTASKKEDK